MTKNGWCPHCPSGAQTERIVVVVVVIVYRVLVLSFHLYKIPIRA
jgi:hypothetical protein